ncbi:MAG: radical SAM protein [Thermodesulfobacteriota bacterium]|nr:radical SAM protein [Thermodesulfobacteriota bacterium]
MKAVLSLTNRCNLSCPYCYSGKKQQNDMELATAEMAVDFAIDRSSPREKIEYSFFGGEPLLCFDLIQEIVTHIRMREQEITNPVTLSITTNGTVLDQAMLDFFRKEKVNLCISIDGMQDVHDINRSYANGASCFRDVIANLYTVLNQHHSVQVNAVYGPETVKSLPETVAFFIEQGVPAIHLNPDISSIWSRESYTYLDEAFSQIARQYTHCFQQGKEVAINCIDSKVLLFLKGGCSDEDHCGMGESQWAFAASGNIYPCERLIGEDDGSSFCMGNVRNDLMEDRRLKVLDGRGNRNQECRDCELSSYCMNQCGCSNYYMTGYTDLAGSLLCRSEKAAIGAARYVLTTLSESENELFSDHLMRYFNRE